MATKMKVKVKWGSETYENVEVDVNESPEVFKGQLFALTHVPPDRQKVMIAGKKLGDSWGGVKVKAGMMVMLMGTAEAIPDEPVQVTKFLEDMTAEELGEISHAVVPAGLSNLGNTCYMNSVLQVLRNVPDLEKAVKQYNNTNGPQERLVKLMGGVFQLMSQSGGEPVMPMQFLGQLYSVFPDFGEKKEGSMVPMQQDAEECFSRLLTTLDGRLGGGADDALIKRLFAIKLSVNYRCEEADSEQSESMEMTFKLPCHIGKDTSFLLTGITQSLEEHMTKFSASLNREAVFEKKQRIARLPKHVVVQFVRFYWKQGVGKKEGNRAKIVKPIQFPEILDLFDLCHDSLKEKLKVMRMISEQKEEEKLGLGDPNAMKLDPPHFDADDNQTGKYRLSALITHEGYSADGGHYVAWVRSSEGKQTDWYLFDDDKVTKQTFETVTALSRSTGDAPIPYLLVYSTVSPTE